MKEIKTNLKDSDRIKVTYNKNEVDMSIADFKNSLRGYKVYRALVTQSSTNAPTVTVLENTLGGTVTWSYTGVGDYLATLAGAFPDIDKVFMMSDTPINVPGSTYSLYWNDTNSIGYGTGDKDGIAGNGRLYKTSLEIRVYE